MMDPPTFQIVVGSEPRKEKMKCEKARYKNLLLKAIREAGHIPTLEGTEFAKELVEAMDLYRSGKEDQALKAFIQDMRNALKVFSSSGE